MRVAPSRVSDAPWLVVGLGNPGSEYAATRHNIGYRVADELAERVAGRWQTHRQGRARVVECRLGGFPGVRAVLARPRSYMNESGGPVAALAAFFKVPSERIVAVHDELDLPYGDLRLKLGGGDNGHNGLKSIRRSLGTGDFHRIRFGIGRPQGQQAPADFVLSAFSVRERTELPEHVARCADAVVCLVTAGLEQAQNTYNR